MTAINILILLLLISFSYHSLSAEKAKEIYVCALNELSCLNCGRCLERNAVQNCALNIILKRKK